MKFKINYLSLLLLFVLVASGLTMAQTPANNATGVSATTNFAFVNPTTEADQWLQVSTANTFLTSVLVKDLGPIGTTGYTFNASDLQGSLAGHTQFNNNTTYYWRILSADQSTVTEPAGFYTFKTVLGPPTGTAASLVTSTSFSANWTANSKGGATAYILKVGTTSGGTDIVNAVNVGNVLTYSVTGLTPNHTYYYSVEATDGTNITAYSNEITATTLLGAPTANTASLITSSSFSANWTANVNGGATAYILKVGTTSGGTDIVNAVNVGNVLTYSVTGLNPNTTYYYSVEATNGTSTSAYSNEITATTLLGPPTATTASSITSSGFTANWTANAHGGATAYILRVGTTSGGTDVVNDVNVGNVTSHAVSGLNPNTTYYYSVKATDGTNTTVSSNEITTATLLGPPTATTATSVTSSGFTANWTANAHGGATAYIIRIGTTSGGTDIVNDANVGNVLTYAISGLNPNTQYFYSVKATDGTNTTVSSNEITTGTLIGPPTATAATSITSTGFAANWTANAHGGASAYILRVGTTSGGTDIVNDVNVGNVLTYAVSGLTASTNYYYSVKATDGTHTTVSSNEITATTQNSLAAPVASSASSVASSSFTANWATSSGATSYILKVGTTSGGSDVVNNVNVGNVTSHAVTGLTQNTHYYYSVQAYNGTITSVSSNEITVLTLSASGVPVTGPINGITGVSILPTFTWNDIFDETSYTVNISTDSAAFNSHIIATHVTAQNATSWATADTIAGLPLQQGTKYYWQITVNGGASNGAVSAIEHFTTTQAFTLNMSTPSDSATVYTTPAVFSWYLNKPVSGMRFIVQYKESLTPPANNTFWLTANTLGPDTTQNDSASVKYGKTYYWRVIAERSTAPYDVIYDSPAYFMFKVAGGSSVTLYPSWPLGGTTVYTNTPQLSWYPSQFSAGLSYQVRYSTASTVDSTGMLSDVSAISIPLDANIATATSNLYTVLPTLTAGKTYYWEVRAYYDSTGVFSNWSTVESFVTFGTGTPVVPVPSYPLANETVYSTSPTLYWYLNSPSSGLYYDVELSKDSTFSTFVVDTTTGAPDQMSFDLNTLIPGQAYFWRVRSSNGTATSAWSDSAKFTIAGGLVSSYPIASWPIGVTPPIEYTPQPTLSWYMEGSPLGISGFTVKYIKGSAPADWTTYTPGGNTVAGGSYNVSASTFSTQITTNLTYGATYYWAVYANDTAGVLYNILGQGSFTVVGGSAGAAIVLSQPGDGTTVYSTTDSLSWYINGSTFGLLDYELQMSQSDVYTPLVHDYPGIIGTDTAITGLVNGATYYWRVGARYSDTTFWSTWYSFTVNTGSPSIVQPIIGGPNHVQINTSTPMLSWVLPAPVVSGTTYDLLVSSDAGFANAKSYNSATPYTQVEGLSAGTNYYWKVQSKDSHGTTSYYSGTGQFKVGTITAVNNDKNNLPKQFSVSQNYPNPFNPSTVINYALPKSSMVTIKIYNILGQEVKTLLNKQMEPGTYNVQWNGDNNFGQHVSSGAYIYRVTAGQFVKTMKMILLK